MMIPQVVSLTRFTQSWLLEVSELLSFGNYFLKVKQTICSNASLEDTRAAAAAAVNKQYLPWNPL
jgi:hypothetical protein